MNTAKDSVEAVTKDTLPNSKKIYVSGKQHPDLRVPPFVIPSEVEGSLTICLIK